MGRLTQKLWSKLTGCNRSFPATKHCENMERPSEPLCRPRCGPSQHQLIYVEESPGLPVDHTYNLSPVSLWPKRIEEGDPLQDEEKLLHGLQIVNPGQEGLNTLAKAPSDEALLPLRWGSDRRATGRSKTGLQIQVPSRKAAAAFGVISGKSITYTYTSSSSSSGGRTTNSFGAVGDHLSPAKLSLSSSNPAARANHSALCGPERAVASATCHTTSPLANLVLNSEPDESPYKLVVAGELGPTRQSFAPYLVTNLRIVPVRRRSLSDLIDGQPCLSCSPVQGSKPAIASTHANSYRSSSGYSKAIQRESYVLPKELDSTQHEQPPMWARKGLPFELKRKALSGESIHLNILQYNLDPSTFSLPYGVSDPKAPKGTHANSIEVQGLHHEVNKRLEPASFGSERSLVFDQGCKQSLANCVGEQKVGREDNLLVFNHS